VRQCIRSSDAQAGGRGARGGQWEVIEFYLSVISYCMSSIISIEYSILLFSFHSIPLHSTPLHSLCDCLTQPDSSSRYLPVTTPLHSIHAVQSIPIRRMSGYTHTYAFSFSLSLSLLCSSAHSLLISPLSSIRWNGWEVSINSA
jgi:hypothetical protein